MPDRKQTFNRAFSEYEEKDLKGRVDFAQHRFVSVEYDKASEDRYVRGHKTMRGACGYLARAVQEGEIFLPEMVLDLDTGDRHDLDLFVTVAPKDAHAVQVVLPPDFASAALSACETSNAEACQKAGKMIRSAIERR